MNLIDRILDAETAPVIVAELSGNHGKSFERAQALIAAAAKAGADAVKLQTYTADSLTINSERPEFIVQGGLWHGRHLYELYQEASTPYEWHAPLAQHAKKLGIELFSTPFDEQAVDFLEETINPSLFKVSSFELTHLPLLERIAQTSKPVIMSTGMGTENEIDDAVSTLQSNGCPSITLLKCISAYPSEPQGFNLRSMQALAGRYACPVGLSDHTLTNEIALASVALGGRLIEKHFTDSRQAGGIDAAFSLEPSELEDLVRQARRTHQALGTGAIGPETQDVDQTHFRRSIYACAPIAAGEAFTTANVKVIRPAQGLAPKHWKRLLMCAAPRRIEEGEPILESDLS